MKNLRDDPAELTDEEFVKALEKARDDILHNHSAFEEQREYLKSDKNLKDCEPYDELASKFIELKREYSGSFKMLSEAVEAAAYRSEYSKGAYYSPSAMDMFVTGCPRGRLYKRTPKPGQYDCEYVFDKDGYLVCVKTYAADLGGIANVELFRREPKRTLSFSFNAFDGDLEAITEYLYKDGFLVSYARALVYFKDKCSELEVEAYEYESDLLKTVDSVTYTPSIKLLDKNRYELFRGADGCLTEYTFKNLNGYVPKGIENEPRKFGPYPVLGAHKRIPHLWEDITKEKHVK